MSHNELRVLARVCPDEPYDQSVIIASSEYLRAYFVFVDPLAVLARNDILQQQGSKRDKLNMSKKLTVANAPPGKV